MPHWGDPRRGSPFAALLRQAWREPTGRPFTGDHAGVLLYQTTLRGPKELNLDDSLRLKGVAIVNSVKCVPPQNKDAARDRGRQLAALPNAKVQVARKIAHDEQAANCRPTQNTSPSAAGDRNLLALQPESAYGEMFEKVPSPEVKTSV